MIAEGVKENASKILAFFDADKQRSGFELRATTLGHVVRVVHALLRVFNVLPDVLAQLVLQEFKGLWALREETTNNPPRWGTEHLLAPPQKGMP